MELLTLVRFRSNVELIRRPKPSNLICQGLKFLLFICIYIKIFTFENYEEPFIVKVSYCHIKLVTAWGGIFGFSWAVTSFGRIFCSVVTYYLLTTFFFLFWQKVPKGWDKLVVSIISVETGKTIVKSSKALVHNGSCQWTDSISETICFSQDDSSKELQDCFFKLVVSMVLLFLPHTLSLVINLFSSSFFLSC